MAKIATYAEVLELLTDQARNGSVTAAAALERVLRPNADERDIDAEIDRIIAEAES
jgi:hypothetical protein